MFNFVKGPVSDAMTASIRIALLDRDFCPYAYLKISRCRNGSVEVVEDSGSTITEFDHTPKDEYLISECTEDCRSIGTGL